MMNISNKLQDINKFILIGLIFFLSSLRAPNIQNIVLDYRVPNIVGQLQNYSLPISILFLLLLIMIELKVRGRLQMKEISSGVWFFAAFHAVLIITDYLFIGSLPDLISKMVFLILLTIFFGAIINNMPYFLNRQTSTIVAVFWGISGFIMLNLLLQLSGLMSTIWKGRFFGLTGQPNFIGMCGGVCTVLSFALLFSKVTFKRKGFYAIGFLGGFITCLMAVSRSATLSSLLACTAIVFFFIKRPSAKMLVLALGIFMSILVYANFSAKSFDYAERGNTREETWGKLFDAAIQLPIFGVGKANSPASTNSYLFAITAVGLFGAFFFFTSIVKIIKKAKLIGRLKSANKIEGGVFYTYVGLTVFLLTAALFEGFLLDAASIPAFIFWYLLSYSENNKLSTRTLAGHY